ncbi:hypothetical protein HYFRA_00013832 [Hymenoscyphus fraxineus]|uniref:F-box domain-containing protein n=1 Tax=Hymenoscyphus fraxineus TaxID=746836 RepID=A0A9N9PVH7_9HELO|nr:hypothetical protein HYFRA_00013832 [Hymenoscyphus fraxineus]
MNSPADNEARQAMLTTLPIEVIQQIADSLPIPCASVLSVCCRKLHFQLGTQHWKRILEADEKGKADWKLFMTLLYEDLPEQSFCFQCGIAHKADDFLLPRDRIHPEGCWALKSESRISDCIPPGFSFTIFNTIMKRHRSGLAYSALLNASQGTTRDFEDTVVRIEGFDYSRSGAKSESAHTKSGFLKTTKALIINGSFYFRVQDVRVFNSPAFPSRHGSANVRLWRRFIASAISRSIYICRHKAKESLPEEDHRWSDVLRPNVPALKIDMVSEIKRCPICETEYQINIQDCGDSGVAVHTTVWVCLGQGRTVLVSRMLWICLVLSLIGAFVNRILQHET